MINFRTIILLLVALGLLWNFNTSAISGSLISSAENFDLSQNNEEEDDSESKDLKFLSNSANFLQLQNFSFAYKTEASKALLPNLSSIPNTPPDC